MRKSKNQLSILLFTIVACVILAFYVGLIRGEEIVYTHFFYIPIILAGVWYHRKAIYPALFLSIVHILVTRLSPRVVTIDNFSRCAILIAVAYVIGLISEKRAKGEDKLRETRDYLEKLINYANAPIIVWDTEFRIRQFNHAFEHLSGYTANEVIGKELSMLFPEASRDESMRKIQHTMENEHWECEEIPILHKNGDIKMALWTSANIYGEDGTTLLSTIAQGTDITKRRQAEEALAKSKAYTESIIKNFLDTLIVVDTEAKIQTVNPETCRLLGYTEKELIGWPVSIIFAEEEEEEEEVRRLFQFFREPKKTKALHPQDTIRNRELTYKTKNGRLIPMSFNASTLTDEAGNVTGVVAGAKDITEIKQVEEARRKSEEHHRKAIEDIFKFIPEGLLVFSNKLNLLKENKAFRDIVQRYASMLNYTEKKLTEIIIEQVKNRIINEDYTEIRISKKQG